MRTKLTRNRYMGTYRLGMLSAGLAVWVLLLDLSLSAFGITIAETAAADSGSQATPTALGDRLLAIQKRIVLRTEDGAPVPGIDVQLAPADPSLGGPETRTAVQTAVTQSDGTATFSGLGQWVWMVSFSGNFEGNAIQPVQEQGKAPYGRTRGGGGFPVIVQRQDEDAPATPIVVQGTPLPEVQPSLFVLASVQRNWVPMLDLALPGEHPQPLTKYETPATLMSGAPPTVRASGAISSISGATPLKEEDLDSIMRWLYLLPAAIGLLAIYRAWQDWRERKQAVERATLHSDSEVPEDAR